MPVYLDPSKSARENLTFIGNQAASTTKDHHDCIITINSQGNADKCNFFTYSTIALPILGFIFDRNVSRPVAIVTTSMAVFTALLAKYQSDSLDTSCRTLKMYQGQSEAILTIIGNYLDTKRSQKQDVLIDLFNQRAQFSYLGQLEYSQQSKSAQEQIASFAKIYDENRYEFHGKAQLKIQCQEYCEIIPIAKNILTLNRPIAISEYQWNKLQASCRNFLDCDVYLGCSSDNRTIIATKDRI